MNKKYELNATPEQITKLKQALGVGSPLTVALAFSGISTTTYYYWIEIAAVVSYVRSQEFAKKEKENIRSGVSFSEIQDSIQESELLTASKKAKEPSPEAIQRYKMSRQFKEFADKIYAIVNSCNEVRSQIVMHHLIAIRDAATKRGVNANASQWFLERTMSQYFGRKDGTEEAETAKVKSVKIEYIDSDNKDTKERVKAMEQLVEHELGGEPNKA